MITPQPPVYRVLGAWTPHSACSMSNVTTYCTFTINVSVLTSLSYLLDFLEILC
jgi:hypothetical protein